MKTHDIPIGARVTFRLGGRPVQGRILQDRGPIGVGGRHLYQVYFELGKGNWYSTELPAEEIEDIQATPVNQRKMREVGYIVQVEADEAHSLFAKPEHARRVADFPPA